MRVSDAVTAAATRYRGKAGDDAYTRAMADRPPLATARSPLPSKLYLLGPRPAGLSPLDARRY